MSRGPADLLDTAVWPSASVFEFATREIDGEADVDRPAVDDEAISVCVAGSHDAFSSQIEYGRRRPAGQRGVPRHWTEPPAILKDKRSWPAARIDRVAGDVGCAADHREPVSNTPSGSRLAVISNALSAVGRSARLEVCRDPGADGYRSVTRHAAGDRAGPLAGPADGLRVVHACALRVGEIAVGQHDEQVDVAGLSQPGRRCRTGPPRADYSARATGRAPRAERHRGSTPGRSWSSVGVTRVDLPLNSGRPQPGRALAAPPLLGE